MDTTEPIADPESRWAHEEFGSAKLGNKLRTNRLVTIAAHALRNPAALMTEVFSESHDREGAYRFAENDAISVSEICAAACRGSATRAAGKPFVFVPVDGTSISLREYNGDAERGLGRVGTYQAKGTGILVMNAIAVDADGTPLGLFDQQWWTRENKERRHHAARKLEDKETKHWLAAIHSGMSEWEKVNPETKLWFQLDRGGDFRHVLDWAQRTKHFVTVRAAWDRCVADPETKYLWPTLEATALRATTTVELRETKKRKARTARLQLRWKKVTLVLRDPWSKKKTSSTLWAVFARELGTPADGSEPVEWMLLTNRCVRSRADAELVLHGYTLRWRVEEFHRVWKSVCKVERTQLRDAAHIERWATVLAAVAMRILRLTHLARVNPGLPATTELSKAELVALIVEKGRGTHKLGDPITIKQAIEWIAELGGYVGEKASGGPPGPTVLSRGMRKLASAAETIVHVLDFIDKT